MNIFFVRHNHHFSENIINNLNLLFIYMKYVNFQMNFIETNILRNLFENTLY